MIHRGTIKKLTDKGYGFISVDDPDQDLFFHAQDLQGVSYEDLNEGDRLRFGVGEGRQDKPRAIDVSRD